MKLKIDEARELAMAALRKGLKFSDADAQTTADHLVDAALRGVTFGSLARILAISDKMAEEGDRRRPITTIREADNFAMLDGGDNVGYVVAHQATRLAIEKAARSGMAVVGANNTYYTGLFSYYMEMATRRHGGFRGRQRAGDGRARGRGRGPPGNQPGLVRLSVRR
jgi:delta1-piperideine-2-carboxylate reductase